MQTPYLIVQALLDSFPQLRVTDPDTHDKLLALKEHYISPNGGSLSKKELSSYKELADKITAVAKQVPNSNTLYIFRFAELMKQSLSLEEGFLGGGYAAKRDEYMARNAIWIKENFTAGTEKMIIWAHNDHIAHAKIGGNYRMGYYLKAHYKENYYALSLVFDEGYTRAYDKTAKEFKSFYYPSSTYKGAIESVLKNISHPSFFINLTSGNNELTDFFAKNKYQKSVGQAYHSELNKTFLKLPVIECFDGLIFIKKTTAAESMN
jgi:erythromycin esterase-like protein